MSMIDKLQILGVRSFDFKRPETIQFLAPLTLIVGYNGSGKTTIIECLKYATTGDLPANSKTGGAFIHDPDLAGERQIMAQAKLSFLSTSGTKMVATRSLELNVRKTTRSQKTLESILLMNRNGERTTVSSRAAELDQLMPQYLGVSKAVLEYVIFCHQDDSLWPLSDSSSLKKRFDEIFEALKYTKAIENIKVLRKKQREELGKLEILAQHAKEDKNKGDKAEKRSIELSDEIEALRTTSNDLRAEIADAVERSQAAWEHYSRFATIVGNLENHRIKAQNLEANIADLKQHMKVRDDSDEQLQQILDQYDERLKSLKENIEALMNGYRAQSKDVEKYRTEMGVKQSEVGRYQAQKDQYERQLQNRTELIKETARRHTMRGFDHDLNEERVREFMDRIGRMAKDQNRAFEKARQESQEETQTAQRSLNELQNRKAGLNQSKDIARDQGVSNDRKIASLQADYDKIEVDEGRKANLESAIKDVERRLTSAKADFQSTNWDQQIETGDKELRSLDDQHAKLNAELIQATRRAGDSAQVDFLRKELKDRQRSLETMIGAHGPKISKVVGDDWETEKLERDFSAALANKSNDVRDAENQRAGVSRELEQVEFQLASVDAERKTKTQSMQAAEAKVKKAIEAEAEDFPETLQTLQGNRDSIRGDTTSFTVMQQYYRDCIGTVNDHGVCRLCMRAFKADKDKSVFLALLEKKLRAAADSVAQEEIEQLENDLKRAKGAQSDYDTWLRLKDVEIPSLVEQYAALETKRLGLIADLDSRDQVVNDRQGDKRDVESLQKTVQTITNYHAEVASFTGQLSMLAEKQKSRGASRGLELIQEDLEKLNEKTRRAKSTLSQLTEQRNQAKEAINSLELEDRDNRSKLSNATYQLKERAGLQLQIEEFKTDNNAQKEKIRGLDKELQDLVPTIAQAQETYDDARRRGDEKIRELQTEASKLSDSLNQLNSATTEIDAYVKQGGTEQLAASTREVERLMEKIASTEQDKLKLTSQIKKIEEELRSEDETRRAVNDNLRYRRDVRELEAVRTEIMELEGENAEEDKARYEREGQRWDNKRSTLTAEQASIVGTLKSKDEQLAQLLKDWETDYKDAAFKYREAVVKLGTTRTCVEDLGKYGGALDKAIMKFHSLKMEEINRIIEELWKKTYQGTDVDTIVIRSDNETQKGNRSYNYRVCMVKADAEMDMRGRCSAGQKVLASIIIRLALAECFGVNCGIIALDEPTTNLDRDNIRALAESLAEIIRIRRKQSNFQLIVITHDEEFLRQMNCADFVDNYYRVSRDHNMKSIIERQSIGEVMA